MTNKHTFILVHGAWHASWCWARVARQLRAQGHHVLTPDLPGHGALIRPAHTVTFTDYVNHICQLAKEQPEPVTLVGHSMAGLIISEVADQIPEHVQELVFLSAYIPRNQESLASIAKSSASHNLSPYLIIDEVKRKINLKPTPHLMTVFYDCCSPEDAQDAFSRLQAQPYQPFIAPVTVGDNFNRIPKRALIATQDQVLLSVDQLSMSQRVTDRIIPINADHASWFSAENDIVHVLLNE